MLGSIDVNVVGHITFDGKQLDVYSSVEVPIFKVSDIATMIGYSSGNSWSLLDLCEEDEKLNLRMVVAGQRRNISFVTEIGLYNILAQSRMTLARKWRKIVHEELIALRQARGNSVVEQFDEWGRLSDTLYIDPETGIMMQSVTVAGGDVEQIPYVEGKINE